MQRIRNKLPRLSFYIKHLLHSRNNPEMVKPLLLAVAASLFRQILAWAPRFQYATLQALPVLRQIPQDLTVYLLLLLSNFHVRISHLSLAKRTRARNSRHIVLLTWIWCHRPSLLWLVHIYCSMSGGKILAPKSRSRFSLTIHTDLRRVQVARVRHI